MAFNHGKGATLSVDDSGGTPRVVAGIDSVSLSQNGEPAEVTSLGDASKAFIAGLKDATLSISGSWSDTASVGSGIVLAGIVGGDAGTVVYSPDGGTTTYTNEALCTSYQMDSPIGDKVSFSAEFQFSGAIT